MIKALHVDCRFEAHERESAVDQITAGVNRQLSIYHAFAGIYDSDEGVSEAAERFKEAGWNVEVKNAKCDDGSAIVVLRVF